MFCFFSLISILLKWYFLSQRGYEMDIATFLGWAQKITDGGFWSLYSSGYQVSLDYPPLIPYLTGFLDASWRFARNIRVYYFSPNDSAHHKIATKN